MNLQVDLYTNFININKDEANLQLQGEVSFTATRSLIILSASFHVYKLFQFQLLLLCYLYYFKHLAHENKQLQIHLPYLTRQLQIYLHYLIRQLQIYLLHLITQLQIYNKTIILSLTLILLNLKDILKQ